MSTWSEEVLDVGSAGAVVLGRCFLVRYPNMKLIKMVVAAGLALGCGCFAQKATKGVPEIRQVDSFDLSACSCGMGKTIQIGKSVDGHPLTLDGKVHAHGFGTHPESGVAFTSNGGMEAFDALVGLDDDAAQAGSGEHWVKDLWRQKCEGKHAGVYVAKVPPHATKLVYVRPVACSKCE